MFDTITCMTAHWYSGLFNWLYTLTLSMLDKNSDWLKWQIWQIELVTSQLDYLALRSEANTIFQAFQVENSLKPKEQNIKLN